MTIANAVIGIDPGKTGCACLLKDDLQTEFFPWPKDDDIFEVLQTLRCWGRNYHILGAILEKVGSMPGQGVKSMFTFGDNNGCWRTALIAADIPYFRPTPQLWQRNLITKGDGPNPKLRSYAVASKLFPHIVLKGSKGGILDGHCDALLMAWFGVGYYNMNINKGRTRVR